MQLDPWSGLHQQEDPDVSVYFTSLAKTWRQRTKRGGEEWDLSL